MSHTATNRRLAVLCLGISYLFVLVGITPIMGQEWTRFRGPNGAGVSTATHLPVHWTEKDYHWKVKLPGVGHSSPVLWGERLFVTCGDNQTGKRVALCLRTTDGGQLWQRDFPGEKHGKHQDNSFASATPVVDEKQVYFCWGGPKEYLIVALDHAGKESWRIDLGPFKSGHGFGSSPLLVEDLLIVPNDQDGKSELTALERDTGKIRWKVPRQCKASYATPCLYQPKGGTAEVILTSWEQGIVSIDPRSGKKNWEIDVFSKGHVETPIASPIVAGELIIGTCGWLGVKKEVVAVRPDPTGKLKVEQIYRIDRGAPLCVTPLVKDELLFLWSDEGIVTCAGVRTGEVHWQERVPGTYYSSPIAIGKHLYCCNRDGDVIVLEASKKFNLVGRNSLGEGSHSTPAVSGGKMYWRTFSHLIAIGGK